jgi:hypothetical protein
MSASPLVPVRLASIGFIANEEGRMDEIARLTAKLLQEREARRTAERSARAYQQQAKRLKEKLAALAHHKPDHEGAPAE